MNVLTEASIACWIPMVDDLRSSFHNVVVGCELDFSLAKTVCQGTSMASMSTRLPLWIGPSRGKSFDSGNAFL